MRRVILALAAGLVTSSAAAAPETAPQALAQGDLAGLDAATTWTADANGPGRFVGVHGRRSSIMGYPDTGLEVWSFPLQLLSGYQVRFREPDRIEPLEGRALLSRIETSPGETVRVYIGPDFMVRERLFTPLDAPGAIITYEVQGRPEVQVEARFRPSLDLMWPGGLGGQEALWDDVRSGYAEREPVHGFAAIIRSPQAIAHDSTTNTATGRPEALGLRMAPRREADGVRRATLIISQDRPAEPAAGALSVPDVEREVPRLRAQARAHYASVLDEALQITTPDPQVNRALAASILAVEQAWVCTPQIGCGVVGGYGPSRPGRRPQYAWYFAGDGLITVEGLLAAGRHERARDELEFIARRQNKANGMIWHEMSTSAPLIDWEKRYPYMYVHVDITLQYLSTLRSYVETTGDVSFLKAHWTGIQAAWRYASSLIDPATRLPSIPAGKQGQNEQAVLRDDVRLSSAWIDAADGFAQLARTQGDVRLAREGEQAAQAARAAVRANGWDDTAGFWLGGHTAAGAPVHEERPDASGILLQGAFTEAQAGLALDRLATPDFQTDWGVRSLSASHPDYDPNAYSQGAVWGLGASGVATTFWKAHRPSTAWSAWHGLLAWTTLDSPGRLHEVTAGDLFHPELESAPEQTWSSAGYLTAAVTGLLGLEVHGGAHALRFAPHLPADWDGVRLDRVRVGASLLGLHMVQDSDAVTLEINNPGGPATVDFDPQVPLGARLLGAEVNGIPVRATVEPNGQDQHARVSISAGPGITRAIVRYSGGVRIAPVETLPQPADASVNIKLASASLVADTLKLGAYVIDPAHAAIDLITPMTVTSVQGAEVSRTAKGYRLTLHVPASAAPGRPAYARVEVTATLGGVARAGAAIGHVAPNR